MNEKHMIIKLENSTDKFKHAAKNNEEVYLTEKEICHILEDHAITDDEIEKCLDLLISFFYQRGIYKLDVDLGMRNYSKAPIQQFTMEELEDHFGSKVEIVKEHSEEKHA